MFKNKKTVIFSLLIIFLVLAVSSAPLCLKIYRYNEGAQIIENAQTHLESNPYETKINLMKAVGLLKTVNPTYKETVSLLKEANTVLILANNIIAEVDKERKKEEEKYLSQVKVTAFAPWIPRGGAFGPLSNNQQVWVKLKNNGNMPLQQITLHCKFLDVHGSVLSSRDFTFSFDNKPCLPGSSWDLSSKSISRSTIFKDIYGRMEGELISVRFANIKKH